MFTLQLRELGRPVWMALVKIMVVTCVFIGLVRTGCAATTYYVDFNGGSDSNAGTTTSTAWRTIPGTRNTGDSAFKSTSWGSINSSNKVPAGTIIKLKSGTTHSSTNGGKVLIDASYYTTSATFANPIIFQRDTSWGSGSVTVDGSGITAGSSSGNGLIEVLVPGVNVDGVAGVTNGYDGIIIRNSQRIGLDYYSTSPIDGGTVQFIKFLNNGTLYSSLGNAGAGSGQLFFKYHDHVRINWCEFDGAGNYFNGTHFGQTSKRATDVIVTNSVAHNHNGSDDTDTGIGFKAENSQVKWVNCEAYGNDKGWDSGDEGADPSWDAIYTLLNCSVHDNQTIGAGFSDRGFVGLRSPGKGKYYIINSVIRNNPGIGIKMYAGPYEAYIVHNVFASNAFNLLAHVDGSGDHNRVRVYYYNNVFYKSSNEADWAAAYWFDSGYDAEYHGDYNSYIQNSTEQGISLGSYGDGSNQYSFAFGSNGPGHTSGTWYNFKSWHNDAHSKGTGATDSTLPPFTSVTNNDFSLKAQYAGLNLSTQAWYIPDMAKDRKGLPRTTWDIGAYEFGSNLTLSAPTNLRITN